MNKGLTLLCLLLFCRSPWLLAQWSIQGSPKLRECLAENRRLKAEALDSVLQACVYRLRKEGYLEMAVDQQIKRNDSLIILAHQGPLYQLTGWQSQVDSNAAFGEILSDSLSAPKSLATVDLTMREWLIRRAKSGYPFSRANLKPQIQNDEGALSIESQTWSGPLIRFGGVRYVEGVNPYPISINYLQRYLRIEPGKIYRQNDLDQASRRLSNLRFVELKRQPVLVFENSEAFVYVDLAERKTSRFDFLLGFLPNSDANDGQLLLTGDAVLELDNTFGKGEYLSFSFERLQPQATEGELELSYPYLMDSPFGVRGQFGLYRQQDDWLRVNYEAGLVYSLGGADNWQLFYEGEDAQPLGFDTAQAVARRRLPTVLDVQRNGFGARLLLDRRDDVFDTRSGWRLLFDGSAALRRVEVDAGIRDLGEEIAMAADSIEGQSAQYRLRLDAMYFRPLGGRSTAMFRMRGAAILGSDQVFRNELYRIGGQGLLRGFDEQIIEAQRYAVASLEYRLLLGGGSFLFAFLDQGWLNDPYRLGPDNDAPTGFGAGLRLGTNAGALNLSYAYGRRQGEPIDWERAKIHIGFESRF